ncbi:MAG: indole-3-glycerol phosphate synthase TrpC [Solirubrobacterales bacterium]
MSKLDELVSASREAVEGRRATVPIERLQRDLGTRTGYRPFKEALGRPGLSVVAEFKRRSPSAGDISPVADLGETVSGYERGGAAALSVLTEEAHFGGSLDDLKAAREASSLPILRKDFIVDTYQLYEAAVAGADAVLLIVAALDDPALAGLYEEAGALDLDCVVEVHAVEELERALAVDVDVIGINNRDLRDLTVDTGTTLAMMADVPAGKTVVAESGYESTEQLEELERVGADAVLIGESVMRTGDPESAIRALATDLGPSAER